jgi:hypothetical protein
LWRGDEPIQNLAGDPKTGAVYMSLVDPTDRTDRGIWALQEPGAPATQLVPARVDLLDTPATGSDPSSVWKRDLWLSPNGARLAMRECVSAACDIRVVDIGAGSVTDVKSNVRSGDVFGIDDANMFGVFDCDRNCPASAIELSNRSPTCCRERGVRHWSWNGRAFGGGGPNSRRDHVRANKGMRKAIVRCRDRPREWCDGRVDERER